MAGGCGYIRVHRIARWNSPGEPVSPPWPWTSVRWLPEIWTLAELLATGGELACGCWPTDRVSTPTADQIAGRAAEWLTQLGLPADLLAARVIMTPACGLGTWPIESATELLRQLGRATPRLAERLN